MSKQMLELADRITNHLVTLAGTNMKLSLTEWRVISNDILSAIATLRSSAESETLGWRWRRKNDVGGFGEWHVTADRPKGEVYDVTPLGTEPQKAGTEAAVEDVIGDMTAAWVEKKWHQAFRQDCEHLVAAVRSQAVCAPKVPWKGSLSVDLRKGALAVNANGVTLIDEAGTCWAIVFPDKNGFYDHAATIAAALTRPERGQT